MRPIFQIEALPRIQYQSALLVLAITCFPNVGYTECTSKCAGDDAGVGEIRASLLEEEEFLRLYGKDWSLMNGVSIGRRSLRHYRYPKKHIPDARGRFLRMANNTASGEDRDEEQERSIGSLQKSTTKRHQHLYKDAYFTSGNLEGRRAKYPVIVDHRGHKSFLQLFASGGSDRKVGEHRTGLISPRSVHVHKGGGLPYYKLNVTGNARCHKGEWGHCWMTITDWEGKPKLNWTKTIKDPRKGNKDILDRSEQDIAQLVEWNVKKKMADAIDDRESRPVNIAVNYFVRVDCTTSDHCSNK